MAGFPVTDSIAYALARLIEDSQTSRRDPSHSDIRFLIERTELSDGDPKHEGSTVGKEKRVRAVISWAIDANPEGTEKFVNGLLANIRSCGGFREQSPNFVGYEALDNLAGAFKEVGFILATDGGLSPVALDALSGKHLTEALKQYISRAKKGYEDAALLGGTSKDLREAVAAHVVKEVFGDYSYTHFPMLTGQAFTALGMTAQTPASAKLSPQSRLENTMYEMACSINALRNQEGSGHGRPWLPQLTAVEAKASVEFIGVILEVLLTRLEESQTP